MRYRNFYFFCSLLLIYACKSTNINHLSDIDTQFYKINAKAAPEDKQIDDLIAPYREQLTEVMDEQISFNHKKLNKRKPNGSLGNWMCDILDEFFIDQNREIDFIVQNYGGLRIPSIEKGPVTVGKIFELMPFENTLVIIKAKGEIVKKLCDHIVAYGGWPLSRNIGFSMEGQQAKDIIIDEEAIDLQRTYTFVTADYISDGGDDCDFLANQDKENTQILIRDAIIEQLRKNYQNGIEMDYQFNNRIKQ